MKNSIFLDITPCRLTFNPLHVVISQKTELLSEHCFILAVPWPDVLVLNKHRGDAFCWS
jgi:hypothetical protein